MPLKAPRQTSAEAICSKFMLTVQLPCSMLLQSFCVLPKKHESLENRVKNLSSAVDEFHVYWGHMQNDHKHDKVGWIKHSELIYHLSDSSYSLGMFAFSQQIIVAATVLLFYFQSSVASQKKKINMFFPFSCVCLCLWLREYVATKNFTESQQHDGCLMTVWHNIL